MFRILSDLHLAHPASLIKHVGQIEPLLEGARTVVFNGDTVELRLKRVRANSLAHLEALKEICAGKGIDSLFINGNHDPDASDLNHLDLMDGRLLVTHGHVLFPGITPWSREAKALAKNHERALAGFSPDGGTTMEEHLEAAREACLRSPAGKGKAPETGLEWLSGVFSEMSNPVRVLAVLRAWIRGPGLAADFATRHRPDARCMVIGHTHLPGFWMRGERLILNTGAFLPWLGRRVVDISDEAVVMREVVQEGESFRPGKEILRRSLKSEEVPLTEVAAQPPPARG